MDSPTIERESVPSCPVCGTRDRRILYEGLEDDLFSVPGSWSLYRCLGCRAAYLDPRPAAASIALAYRQYYTHAAANPEVPSAVPVGTTARIKVRLRNGYLAETFGLPLTPRFKFARRIVPLFFPRHRIAFDTSVRHLPLPRPGARLLDVGCGGGGFLAHARGLGWDVTGTELDPVAAALAVDQGIPVVQRPLAEAGFASGWFEAVTMNHVIEHLHEPAATLREIFRILTPGGLLWISTPNLDSPLRLRLGRCWRGLEAPRHLILFCRAALRHLVKDAGFVRLSWPTMYPLTRWMLDNSSAHRARPPRRTPLDIRLLELGSMLTQRLSEQLVVLAAKPGETDR
jgi:2-polyprenyl-3-methyl-5-hydroxy-6-metoxy-1,4-benzoquinol methylase